MINNELEKTWKEVGVTNFKMLPRQFYIGTEENHEIVREVGVRAETLSPGTPDYEAGFFF